MQIHTRVRNPIFSKEQFLWYKTNDMDQVMQNDTDQVMQNDTD